MRLQPGPIDSQVSVVGRILFSALLVPAHLLAQDGQVDPEELLEETRDLQREFEEFRGSRIPVELEREANFCDERIGRICIWFGGDEEEAFPSEFREVSQARIDLIRSLFDALDQVPNSWVIGQLIHYLVEARAVSYTHLTLPTIYSV